MSATAAKSNGGANGRARVSRIAAATAPKSEPTGPRSLAEALLAFQAEAPKLTKNADGQIQSRLYRYVTLDGVLDDVQPLLTKFELVWTAKVMVLDGQTVMRCCMAHVPSGDFDEWDAPLPCVDPGPQALGSAITYMRRYELTAYLGLAPGDDDDGAAASTQPATAPAEQPTARPRQDTPRPISPSQCKMLRAKAAAAGLTKVAFANAILIGRGDMPSASTNEASAGRFIDREIGKLPAGQVDAVIAQIAKLAASGTDS